MTGHSAPSGAGTIAEKLVLQPSRGEAKRYQIRQLMRLVEEYDLGLEDQPMPDYAITVFWSDEDGQWIADIPDLRGCSASGKTPEEAVR